MKGTITTLKHTRQREEQQQSKIKIKGCWKHIQYLTLFVLFVFKYSVNQDVNTVEALVVNQYSLVRPTCKYIQRFAHDNDHFDIQWKNPSSLHEDDKETFSETTRNGNVQSRRFMLSQCILGTVASTTAAALAAEPMPPPTPTADGMLNNLPYWNELVKSTMSMTSQRRIGGLSYRIRTSVGRTMDELQRDLMQERWDLVEKYPLQLRSYVPLFTTYTDSAFSSDSATDQGLRVALRYEVGRFFASVQRLKQATARRALQEAYVAYADMSLHFDRYMRVGSIYPYYDKVITLEPYFAGISDSQLVFQDPIRDPADVRDLVVLIKGPYKGRTGIVIGIYPKSKTTSNNNSVSKNDCVVKLDRYKGMREIRVVPRNWAAKRLGEQNPDDVFLIQRKGDDGNNNNMASNTAIPNQPTSTPVKEIK